MASDDVLLVSVEAIELEMGVYGLRVSFQRDGVDYTMNLHETRNAHHAATMARMLQDRISLAVALAVADATGRPGPVLPQP